ncbi:MAG: class II D-tagatose-bisphosphate aldolase, non-catalytic subunit, partial [Pseudomonadota bacterium]
YGDNTDAPTLRHFTYGDRIRYYWQEPRAAEAVDRLLMTLGGADLPEPLIAQHLGRLYPAVRAGRVAPRARALMLAAVEAVMADYIGATTGPVETA